jgi:hypothetical protein
MTAKFQHIKGEWEYGKKTMSEMSTMERYIRAKKVLRQMQKEPPGSLWNLDHTKK